MSLAMYAAPFDNNIDQVVSNDTNNHIGKKKIAMNRTQKRYPSMQKNNVNTEKVLSVLQTIHNLPYQESDLADFSPLPPPTSVGVESKIAKEAAKEAAKNPNQNVQSNISGDINSATTYGVYSEDNNHNMPQEYYKRFIPNYEGMYNASPDNIPNYQFSNSTSTPVVRGSNNDVLIDKLNYMINLLEEQQDERTNNVTEEVVLYSFLGVFIIFLVDSFTRVGKYKR